MTFVSSKILWWLLLFPVVALLWWVAKRSFSKRLKLYSAIESLVGKKQRLSSAKSGLNLICYLIVFMSMIVAIAGPQWGFEWVESANSGADIIIAFDISESMLATDVKPNRLELAKRKVYDFLEQLKGDRVGLVAFAGTAFLHSPLTADYDAIKTYLNYLRPDLIPLQGTAVGKAIDVAKQSLLSAAPDESRAKWIMMITDGEDQADNGIGSAKDAYSDGIRIFTLGVGSKEGAPIPDQGGGFKKDSSGKIVLSKLNTSMLTKIASVAGGKFSIASSLGNDLSDFYSQELHFKQELSKSGDKVKKWYNRYQVFLGLALLFSILDYLLSWSYRRKPS